MEDGTETPAVKDVDLTNFTSAVGAVFDDTQSFLGFPTKVPDSGPPPAASTSLKYQFQGSLNAVLDTSWEILPGFILDQVTLALVLNLSSFGKYTLGVQLQATFTVQDVQFLVTGTIPDAQAQSEVDFTLSLQLSDPQETLDARQFLPAIDASLSFDNAFGPVTDDIKSQLTGSASWVAGVTLLIHRTSNASYFLKSVDLSVEAGFTWSPTETVNVTDASITATMSRTMANGPWSYLVHLDGTLTIQDTLLVASADFDIADTSTITLSLQLNSFSGITTADILNVVTPGTSDQSVSAVKAQLPPDLVFLGTQVDNGMNSLTVKIVCSNAPPSGWSITSVAVQLLLPGIVWQSPSENSNDFQHIVLENVYLLALVTHVIASPSATRVETVPHSTLTDSVTGHSVVSVHTTVLRTSTVTWKCTGLLGGTINLRNGQFTLAAQVSYDSQKSQLTIYATLPDGVYGPISALAGDSSFSPAGIDPPILGDIAAQAPVPSECPVRLSNVDDMTGGVQRGLWLTFSESSLTRVLLKASYSGSWMITNDINITSLGIMFDLQNPQSQDPSLPATVTGYVYGSMTVAQSVDLFAFVAGRKNQNNTEFWISLSATLVPDGPLSANPTTVISDQKLLGHAPPTDGWGLPDTFPNSVSDALASTGAFLDVKFAKNTTGTYDLTLLQLQVFTTRAWQIFEGLTLVSAEMDIYMQRVAASEAFSGYINIKGACQATLASNTYNIAITLALQRSLTAPDVFAFDFQVTQVGSNTEVVPSTITTLDMFGARPIDQDQLSAKLPADYPIQPVVFSNQSTYQFLCTANVIKSQQGTWGLDTLTFTFSQAADWVITSKITLVDSKLQLQIKNPRGTNPVYTLLAQGTLKIGDNILLSASVELVIGSSKSGWLKISIVGNYQNTPADVLANLVSDSSITVPTGCPINVNSASAAFSGDLYMIKDSQQKWQLQEVDLVVDASGSWSIGSSNSLVIGSLKLYATFQNLTSAQAIKVIAFRGLAVFDNSSSNASAVAVTATLVQSTLTVSIDIFAQTSVSAGNIISKYVTNWSDTLSAPDLTTDTGLSDYGSKVVASASIVFSQEGGTYQPNTISIDVGTGTGFNGWQIVSGYLVMTNLNLSLLVEGVSDSPSLKAVLSSNLQYLSREQVQTNLNMTLLATRQDLSCHVSLGGCNFAEALYVSTAGRWNIPGDWPSLKSLDLYMNWSQGKGNFTATMEDWTIAGNKTIVAMTNPRLTLNVSKATTNLAASGQLAGEALVFSKFVIPITYDLPDGPLKIFGLDVKKIYQMCKRLLELIEDLEELCMVLADIIGLGEGLEVGLALIALGCGLSAVWDAVKKIFNYSHDSGGSGGGGGGSHGSGSNDNDSGTDNRTNQNSDPSKSTVWPWVVGGSGFCNGIADENVQLLIYPKTTNGASMTVDVTKLTVSVVGGSQNVTTFTPIAGSGVSCAYVRPAALGNYSLWIDYPPTAYVSITTLSVSSTPSVLSSQSLLDVPHNVLVGVVNHGTIWPRDENGSPLRGIDFRDQFTVTFDPQLDVPPEYLYFNDSVQFSYVPNENAYNITAKFVNSGDNISGSPVQITAGYAADATRSIAGGLGLCSGKAGEEVSFQVTILDQLGRAFPTGTCQATLSSAALSNAPVISVASHVDNAYVFSYTRPAAGTDFTIQIMIDSTPMPDCPINLTATSDDVSLSVSKTLLTIKTPCYVGTQATGTLTCFDTLSGLWMNSSNVSSFSASMVFGAQTTTIALQDVGDGTITFNLDFVQTGDYQIIVKSAADPTISVKNSPISLKVLAAPVVSDYRCYGPGLSLGTSPASTYFDMLPLDQYGNAWNSLLPLQPSDFKIAIASGTSPTVTTIGKVYRVTYTPSSVSGILSDTIRVSASGQEIVESPFLVNNISAVAGADVSWESHNLNDLSSVVVVARDSNQNRLWTGGDLVSVSSSDPDPQNWPFVVLNVLDLQDGTYRVTYVPQQLDGVMNIALNGVNCDGSPYTLPGRSQINYAASGDGISSTNLGTNASFSITGTMNGASFDDSVMLKSALLYPSELTELGLVGVAIQSSNNGSSAGSYTVPIGAPLGSYRLKLWINYVLVAGSPFMVQVSDVVPPDPILTITGLDWFGAATLPGVTSSSCTVSAQPSSTLQPNDLVILPSNSQAVVSTIVSQSSNTLRVDFQISTSGTYTMSMQYNGKNVVSQPDGRSTWTLVAVDQNLSLQTWLPGEPAVAWASSSAAGVQASISSTDSQVINFNKNANEVGYNQWANAGWTMPSLAVGSEFIFAYRTRWNSLSTTSEAKFHSPTASGFNQNTSNLLRYYSGSSFWTVYNNINLGWSNQSPSSITANGQWHDILYHVGPDALRIYEDGQKVLQSTDALVNPPPSDQRYDINGQVLDQWGIIDADFESFVTCPLVFRPGTVSVAATEIMFNSASASINSTFFNLSPTTGAISVNYTPTSIQFSTSYLSQWNYWVKGYSTGTLRPVCAVQYRFKCNASGGSETKITLAGNVILRISADSGTMKPQWQYFLPNELFDTISSNTSFVVGGDYVTVLVIVSPSRVVLYENGLLNFDYSTDGKIPNGTDTQGIFHVQHLDVGTAVDVELQFVRIINGLN